MGRKLGASPFFGQGLGPHLTHPHFEQVRGGIEPWLMARWKARVEFLLSVTELVFTARCNARIASTVLATSYSNSVCLSVRPSVCHTPVLCQNDGR